MYNGHSREKVQSVFGVQEGSYAYKLYSLQHSTNKMDNIVPWVFMLCYHIEYS